MVLTLQVNEAINTIHLTHTVPGDYIKDSVVQGVSCEVKEKSPTGDRWGVFPETLQEMLLYLSAKPQDRRRLDHNHPHGAHASISRKK